MSADNVAIVASMYRELRQRRHSSSTRRTRSRHRMGRKFPEVSAMARHPQGPRSRYVLRVHGRDGQFR